MLTQHGHQHKEYKEGGRWTPLIIWNGDFENRRFSYKIAIPYDFNLDLKNRYSTSYDILAL